jgi:3-oxoacyl-[acyl-carrier protein] reductase
MDVDVQGRVAIVTGGASGLGEAAAARLAAEGADVVAMDVAAGTTPGDTTRLLRVDVTDDAEVSDAVDLVIREHGPIAVLINCAGVIGPMGAAHTLQPQQWRHTLEVNLTGTFLVCRAVLPSMIEANTGRIVNFASSAGVDNSAGQAAYNASKAGVISLTQTLSREVQAFGITVNAVCPANVDTPLLRDFLEREIESDLDELHANQVAHAELSASNAVWAPTDIMDLIVFLASPLSSHLSGQFLRMARKGRRD